MPDSSPADAASGPLPPPTTATEPPRPKGTFSSLRVHNYRLYAMGQVVSNTGTWMQRIAQDWLVLSLTGSSAAVGVTTALQFTPLMLFGLYGGVIADRLPLRKLLVITHSALTATSLALAVLILSGHIHLWHLYTMATVLGAVTVVDTPARQSFINQIVGPDLLPNAVSLGSATFHLARLLGPLAAGGTIAAVGTGWTFLLNALSYTALIAALLLLRPGELHAAERAPRTRGQVREGLRHVGGRPDLLWPIVLTAFIGTFGYNFPVWLTAYIRHVFHAGAGAYGLLNTLTAAGALAGALLAARRTTPHRHLLAGSALVFGVLEIAAAFSPALWLFAAFLVLIGMAGLTTTVTANVQVQLATEPPFRGRTISLLRTVFMGGTPIGAPIIGWITDTQGPRAGMLTGGLISTAAAATVGLLLTRTRTRQPEHHTRSP